MGFLTLPLYVLLRSMELKDPRAHGRLHTLVKVRDFLAQLLRRIRDLRRSGVAAAATTPPDENIVVAVQSVAFEGVGTMRPLGGSGRPYYRPLPLKLARPRDTGPFRPPRPLQLFAPRFLQEPTYRHRRPYRQRPFERRLHHEGVRPKHRRFPGLGMAHRILPLRWPRPMRVVEERV